MSFCTECRQECDTYLEDISFDYPGTHCTFGLSGTHHQYGDILSKCCDAEVVDFLDDDE